VLERFTVDSIADEIERQVKGARPSAKMTRRFYWKGKRDGRRHLASEPISAYLAEAVGIATSKIGQEHLEAAEGLERQLSQLRGETARLTSVVDRSGAAVEAAPVAGESSGPEITAPGERTLNGAENLEGALDQLRIHRAATERARREAALAQGEAALDEARARVESIERELADLPRRFRQLIDSCHRTGRFLWARYCSGYEIGRSRRSSPDDEATGPRPDHITFEFPESLDRVIAGIAASATGPTEEPEPAGVAAGAESSS